MENINEKLTQEEHQFLIHFVLQAKQKDLHANHRKIDQQKFYIQKAENIEEESYLSLIRTDIFTH